MKSSSLSLKVVSIVVISVLVLIAGYGTLSHLLRNQESQETAVETSDIETRSSDAPASVTAEPAFIGDLVMRVSATGMTHALREVTVCPRVSGQIVKLPVENGDYVREGSLLMKLDDRELQLALQEAEDELLGAQSQYGFMRHDYKANPGLNPDQESGTSIKEKSNPDTVSGLSSAKRTFEEAKQKYQNGEIDEQAFQRAKFEYETKQILLGLRQDDLRRQKSGLTRAYLAVRRAKLNLSYARICAPFSGYIADLQVEKGQQVSAGKECFKLLDLSRIDVNLEILESDIGRIEVGRKADITFPAYPNEWFHGRVVFINPKVDPENKTTTVTVRIPNPKKKILPGMFASADLEAQIYEDKFLVPKDAIIVRDQRKLVFIVRDGLAKWCYVTTGMENEKYVEILDSKFGLKPVELVITQGHYTLVHDAKVTVEQNTDDSGSTK